MYQESFKDLLIDSALLLVVAILLLMAYLCMHLQSLLLGLLGALLIVGSLAGAILLNPVVLKAESLTVGSNQTTAIVVEHIKAAPPAATGHRGINHLLEQCHCSVQLAVVQVQAC